MNNQNKNNQNVEEQDKNNQNKNAHAELVERIIKNEWGAFDKVLNEGGRADCQDNWNTFHLMRASQYNIWPEEMLVQYVTDFELAKNQGRNLIMEKYAYMEASTAPDEYNKIKESLPEVSEEKMAIINHIVQIQVKWMEEFSEKYPHMAGNSRSIHTYEDNAYNTSYETYLRGELMTYSPDMLILYGRFVVELVQEGRNLAYMTMEQTAFLYGYDSVDAAEMSLM